MYMQLEAERGHEIEAFVMRGRGAMCMDRYSDKWCAIS